MALVLVNIILLLLLLLYSAALGQGLHSFKFTLAGATRETSVRVGRLAATLSPP
jgi:hypothetical protein